MKNKKEIIIRRGPWTFRLRPELADKIDLLAAAIIDPKRRGQARRVKETGGRRAIWKMNLPEAGVAVAFVKHYSKPRFAKQLKHLVRNSRTRQEWEMGLALEARGLPVAKHLFMAERKSKGLLQEDFLVQESLEGYTNFDDWFRRQWQPVTTGPLVKSRRAAVNGFADLIRAMHDRGVLQRDFKPDSVMIGPDGDPKLVDLERARLRPFGRALAPADRVANLAKIDQTFGFIGALTDRLRFLKRYFKNQPPRPAKLRRLILEISRLAEIEWRKRARELRVWAHVPNESYQKYRVGPFAVFTHFCIHRDFIANLVKRIDRAVLAEHVCSWGEAHLPHRLRATWADANAALENTVSLYYRKPPFVPVRSALYPGEDRFGLILTVVPDPPLDGWVTASEKAIRDGSIDIFSADLGRFIRVLHRMGLAYPVLRPDSLLYSPDPRPAGRFHLHRVHELILDRSPRPPEAMAQLEAIARLLCLPPSARAALLLAYRHSLLRWFPLHPCPWDH